jgi:hypothetical protein
MPSAAGEPQPSTPLEKKPACPPPPLGLPAGSVRSIAVLMALLTVCLAPVVNIWGYRLDINRWFDTVVSISLIMVGFYFSERANAGIRARPDDRR